MREGWTPQTSISERGRVCGQMGERDDGGVAGSTAPRMNVETPEIIAQMYCSKP